MEEANNFGLVQTIFTVPAQHSVALLVSSKEMFVWKAALEIVWGYVKEGKKR